MLPAPIQLVVDDMLPRITSLVEGRYAVSIGGSYGRRRADQYSDIDFRLFCDEVKSGGDWLMMDELGEAIQQWADKGITIDGCWIRSIEEVNTKLDQWCQGILIPENLVWTIWGYYLPTDINNQYVIDDPFGIIAGWKEKLRQYPAPLKQALLKKHLESVRYWRDDYHYRHKVNREDVVFLAGLSSRLVHDLIQILFALNETYYVGDGNNLAYVSQFEHVPEDFAAKAEAILYPQHGEAMLEQQREKLVALINETEALVKRLGV